MRRRGFTFWELLGILSLLAFIAALLFPIFARSRENAHKTSCQGNLKQIGLAFKMYNQDYNERMPLIRGKVAAECLPPYDPPYGWVDALYPYLKSTQIFQCPDEELPINKRQDGVLSRFTDYYYNSNLNGVKEEIVGIPSTTVLSGEGNDGMDGSDARYNRNLLPKAWRDDSQSPARRHKDGANYAFVDGHVKWYTPEVIKDRRTNGNDYSFTVK